MSHIKDAINRWKASGKEKKRSEEKKVSLKKKWQRRGIKLAILREQAVEIPRGNGSSGMGLVPGGLIRGGLLRLIRAGPPLLHICYIGKKNYRSKPI